MSRNERPRWPFVLTAFALAGAARGAAAEQPAAKWLVPECSWRLQLPYTRSAGNSEAAPEAVFFLDFAALGRQIGGTPDVGSSQLVASATGAAVPFSLDYRYGDRERLPDEPEQTITGYRGEKFPLAKGKLRRLGYLSVKPIAGATDYALYFNLAPGKADLRDRENATARPWWIEAIVNPEFNTDNNQDGKPDLYTWYAKENRDTTWQLVPRPKTEGATCLHLTSPNPTGGTLMSNPDLFAVDSRAGGRRVVFYQQLYCDEELDGRVMTVSLPNAYRDSPAAAVAYYFGKILPHEWQELCVEGRVRAGYDHYEAKLWNVYNGPCYVGEMHLQLPPDRSSANEIGIELLVLP